MSAQLNILPSDPAVSALLQQELGLPRFIATTLAARGITTVEKAKEFLSPSLDRDWLNPYIIPGLSEVADTVEAALKAGKHIVVFGDFDLDGISSTATLTRGLRELGGNVTPFIPLRFEEGYGLSGAALERVFEMGPDLIVTVDCGIASKHEAEIIKARGIDLAVTDHHEPVDLVPIDVPVADPKCDPDCPSTILAGVGVALKLIQVLGGRMGRPHLWREYTDLATLGTVADLMPMIGENRALVADGIKKINRNPRPCIAALLGSSGVADKEVTAVNISFSLVPRLNAAGRMGDAQSALDLLLTDDFETACKKAADLEAVNDMRRSIEAELSESAREQAINIYEGQRVLVVSGEGWHEGVKGIVASRLVNTYGVPTLLFTVAGDEARGSGRSVGQINLFKAIESVADILTRFGGHEAAVGVTLPADKLEEFTSRLNEYMKDLPSDSFLPRVKIDACVDLDELTIESVAQLDKLAPFGQENPMPKFLARDVMLLNCRAVGTDKNHFSCSLSDGKNSLQSIMFHCSDIEMLTHCGSVVNAAFELQIDEWRGRKNVKAMLKSLVPARACAALEACLNPDSLNFVADLYASSDENLEEQPGRLFECEIDEEARKKNREFWQKLAKENPEVLEQRIIEALIGDAPLHDSQKEVLDLLDRGEPVLAVMPTGRGKSLTFYVHAACEALSRNTTSLFLYPLRALISDQAFHISEALEPFGIATAVLTGETGPEERAEVFTRMGRGECDIVLTTPEFLNFHIEKFKQSGEVGFVVVDEAHHIGQAKAGHRMAYARIGWAIAQLGTPTVLALTATADKQVAGSIKTTLGIDHTVYDETVRTNLEINDQRNLKDRENYLARVIARGEKTVIYVNSREQSIVLARSLRKLVPQMASLIGFYNAGLNRSERKRIEELFRTDALAVLVATSAFGEGVNIPNIRHVVLYHLPFNEVEFNQMSGRAGRDGNPATIHLLFGRNDVKINEQILADMTPDHDCLAQVYRELRRIQKESPEEFFPMSNEELAKLSSRDKRFPVSAAAAACGISVFRELGLITTVSEFESGETRQSVHVCETQSKVELTDSIRYCEGLGEREIFYSFRDWVMKSAQSSIRKRISQAILPYGQNEPYDKKGGTT